ACGNTWPTIPPPIGVDARRPKHQLRKFRHSPSWGVSVGRLLQSLAPAGLAKGACPGLAVAGPAVLACWDWSLAAELMGMTGYKIGYGKPPKGTQFKKGTSGNPKGRPKGSLNLSTDLAAELSEQITLREGGRSRRVSKQRALIKSLLSKALQGDV